jgi:hypothetical protein
VRDREQGTYDAQKCLSNDNTDANEQNSDKYANKGILQDFVHRNFNTVMTRLGAQIFSKPGDLPLCGNEQSQPVGAGVLSQARISDPRPVY